MDQYKKALEEFLGNENKEFTPVLRVGDQVFCKEGNRLVPINTNEKIMKSAYEKAAEALKKIVDMTKSEESVTEESLVIENSEPVM